MKRRPSKMEQRIAALEGEVQRLKAVPSVKYEYHYHYDAIRYSQLPPYQPWYPCTTSGGAGASSGGVTSIYAYSDSNGLVSYTMS